MSKARVDLGYKKEKRFLFVLSIILGVSMILFWSSSLFVRLSFALISFILFYLFDGLLRLKFNKGHYAAIIIIIIAGCLMSPLFFIYPYYDKVLHFLLPILTAYLIFHCIDKLDLKLKWKLLFTLASVVAILGVFEIIEYTLDLFLDLKLQGVYLRDSYGLEKLSVLTEPIDDTMIDMVFGLIGSGLYCIYGYFKNKN
ncbi:MAG: hypothetical protein AABX11_03100 [Nanoarchaeota archaeon]